MSEISFTDCYRNLIAHYSMPREWAKLQLIRIFNQLYDSRGAPATKNRAAENTENDTGKAGDANA